MNVQTAFKAASEDRFEEPVVERIHSLFAGFDFAFFAIAQSGDFGSEQLIPEFPTQTIRDLPGDLSAAATVLTLNGQDFNHDFS
jgi:hypothetical protein